jgi:uncharacterized protein (TIGR03086 family)
MIDLVPAAREVAMLAVGIQDRQLDAATPCEGKTVGDLLDHFMGLTVAFRDAATKASLEAGYDDGLQGTPAEMWGSGERLDPDWRRLLPQRLDELTAAWAEPAAWEGMARAGGVTLPAEVMGLVALDELVLHGWDLSRGTDQPFSCDPVSLKAVHGFVLQSTEDPAAREGVFGPVVEVPEDARLLDRTLGLAGRDPDWTP